MTERAAEAEEVAVSTKRMREKREGRAGHRLKKISFTPTERRPGASAERDNEGSIHLGGVETINGLMGLQKTWASWAFKAAPAPWALLIIGFIQDLMS